LPLARPRRREAGEVALGLDDPAGSIELPLPEGEGPVRAGEPRELHHALEASARRVLEVDDEEVGALGAQVPEEGVELGRAPAVEFLGMGHDGAAVARVEPVGDEGLGELPGPGGDIL
jgi:hypothetical protein